VLRTLRGSRTGEPTPGRRLLALLVIVGLVGLSAPVLLPAVAWLLSLF
jgi:hypothetical protein